MGTHIGKECGQKVWRHSLHAGSGMLHIEVHVWNTTQPVRVSFMLAGRHKCKIYIVDAFRASLLVQRAKTSHGSMIFKNGIGVELGFCRTTKLLRTISRLSNNPNR